jgi:hypothetical protein
MPKSSETWATLLARVPSEDVVNLIRVAMPPEGGFHLYVSSNPTLTLPFSNLLDGFSEFFDVLEISLRLRVLAR